MNTKFQSSIILGFLLFIFSVNSILSQNEVFEKIREIHQTQVDEVTERVYLHLPKLVFWQNEYIWFAGYVYDVNYNTPMLATTNVYCGIYDSSGNQIAKDIFYVENGTFHGQMKIPENYGTGKFYIKAYTNWMKNFPEEKPYLQDIYVVNKDEKELPKSNDDSFEILLHPEGGNLVVGIENTISVSLLNTKEVPLKLSRCDIVNQRDEVIVSNVNLNENGKGKFYITPELNQNYSLRLIASDGQQLSRQLPEALQTGFTLTTNNLVNDKVIVNLKTNNETLKLQNSESYFLAISGTNELHNIIELEVNKVENIVVLPKENLLNGINNLTFYNKELEPIASRIIYNEDENVLGTASEVAVIGKKLDSLQLKITPSNLDIENSAAYLSVAVLPKQSMSANVNTSLLNWLQLRPVLGDETTSRLQFYKDNATKALYNIDLSLMASKSSLKQKPNSKPTNKFEFEKGFTISGKVDIPQSYQSKKIFAFQKQYGSFLTTTINANNTFKFDNVYLIADDDLNISIEDKDNLELKNIDLIVKPVIKTDTLSLKELSRHTDFETFKIEQSFDVNYDSLTPSLLSATNVLDEVVLKAKKKTEMTRNVGLSYGVFETKKISDKERKKWPKLSTYVRQLGFRIRQNLQNNTFFIFGKSLMDSKLPIIYVDGFRTNEGVQDFTLNMIDEIYYEHFGVEGSDGGTIYIYTRFDFSDDKKAIANKKNEIGYRLPIPFEYSSFDAYTLKDFVSYGLIYWNGNAKLDKNGSLTIKFPTFNLDAFILQINGFTEDGELISIHKEIEIDE